MGRSGEGSLDWRFYKGWISSNLLSRRQRYNSRDFYRIIASVIENERRLESIGSQDVEMDIDRDKPRQLGCMTDFIPGIKSPRQSNLTERKEVPTETLMI